MPWYTQDGFLTKTTAPGGEVSSRIKREYDNDFQIESRGIIRASTVSIGYDDDLPTRAGYLVIARANLPHPGTPSPSVPETIIHHLSDEKTWLIIAGKAKGKLKGHE